jgi:glycosyltransferase involved in cell wall biosynthesis
MGLTAATASRGHRVILAMVLEPGVAPPAWSAALTDSGVTVEPLYLHARAYGEERRRVLSLARRHGADVVHTHGFRSDVVDGPPLQRAGYPVVSTAHGFVRVNWRGRLYARLQVRALRDFDAVVAVSRPLVDELSSAGVPATRLVQITNGFVPSLAPRLSRAAARGRLDLPMNGPVIGWVGRLSEEKAPEVAINALGLLHHREAVLCVIGDGPQAASCRALADRAGVGDRVRFAGAIPNAETLFNAFDVFVLSSRTEGTPMVLLEAADARVPIVATAVGGVPDVLGNSGGLLVPPDDPALLAGSIDASLDAPADALARTERMALKVSAPGAAGDWVEQYARLYERLRASAR